MKSKLSQNSSGFKDYYCPHCGKFIFKGNVKKLNMVCHHCQKLISAFEHELLKSEKDDTEEVA